MEVIELSAMAAIPQPTMGWMGLPTALAASTVVDATQPVEASPMKVEVAVAMIGGPQLETTVAAPKASA